MENSVEVSQKLGLELPYDPVSPYLGINSKGIKSEFWRGICTHTPIHVHHIAIHSSQENSLNICFWMNEYRNCGSCTEWNITQPWERRKLCHLKQHSVSVKEPACQYRRCKRCGFNPWVGKIPWRRAGQPTPLFLPGESHEQRSLVGYSPQGCKESDTTEQLNTHAGTTVRDVMLQYMLVLGLNFISWKLPFVDNLLLIGLHVIEPLPFKPQECWTHHKG